jgi:hypothetical protein
MTIKCKHATVFTMLARFGTTAWEKIACNSSLSRRDKRGEVVSARECCSSDKDVYGAVTVFTEGWLKRGERRAKLLATCTSVSLASIGENIPITVVDPVSGVLSV